MTIDDRARRAANELRQARIDAAPPIDTIGRTRARRRVRRASAAVMVLAVAAVVSVWLGDADRGHDSSVVAGSRDEGRTPPLDPTSDTTTMVVTTMTSVAAPAGRPAHFLAVRENGDLVLVGDDVTKVLVNEDFDDDEGPDYGIDAVALDARRRLAYYSVCCEPAHGLLRSVPLAGGQGAPVNEKDGGYHPTVSPDGRFLAIGLYTGVGIIDLATNEIRRVESEAFVGGGLRPAWSPDGRLLAVGHRDGPRSSVFVMRSDATSFDEIVRITPDGKEWALPTFRGDGRLVVAEQCCGLEPTGEARGVVVDPMTGEEVASFPYEAPVRDQSYDDSGTYLLAVTTDGVLRWWGAGKSGELGRGYRLADW